MFAAALAYRVLVSLVPLTLLGLGLLGVLERKDLWRDDLGPAVKDRVTLPVYRGIDSTVEKIFAESAWTLVAFAALLALWHVSRGIRVVMKALNAIHDKRERRSAKQLLATDIALSLVLGAALTGAFLLVVFVPRLAGGVASLLLQVAAWLGAGALFAVAVGVLVRYAPAEHPEARWASAGSLLIVAVWIVASVAFGWWAGSVANYKSAVGSLAVFLVLSAYVLVSSVVFLAGVQIDELARRASR